ncbi:MAG: porin [Paracoccaceae bacterium]
MKKVLFATTALIASAGIAAADGHSSVTVGGYGFAGVVNNGTDTDVSSRVRLTFAATVETDAGVTFSAGARMNISNNTVDANSVIADGTDSSANTSLERGFVRMTADGLTVTVGATNGAMRSLARQATFFGFNDGGTLGFDNSDGGGNAFARNSDANDVVYAAYETGGLTIGLSSDTAGNTAELAARYEVGSVSFGVGINDDDGWMLGVEYSGGALGVEVGINSESTLMVGLAYDVSSTFTISAALQDGDDGDVIGIQGDYDLGGANLIGAIGQNKADDTVASLGVIFSF